MVRTDRHHGGGFCPRRTGRLLSGSTAFFAKESGGKESAEGALPPLHSPQCASRLNVCCGRIAPVRCHLGGSFPPMRVALYCHARQVTAKTGGLHPQNGAAPEKGRLFFPRFLFREKKSGATRAGCSRRVGGLCGEHRPILYTQYLRRFLCFVCTISLVFFCVPCYHITTESIDILEFPQTYGKYRLSI